jgi:tetratricopeptide (TPR) repeat protein
MRRQPQEIAAALRAALFLAAALAAGLPSLSVKGAGNNSTVTEGIAIEGSVSNSTINNTVNKQDPAVLAAMAKTFADQMAATTEAKAQAEARAAELAMKFGFTSAAVGEFFKILGEQNVPEEKVPARLIEIATHFAQTRDELAALEPDDPHAAAMARSAKKALRVGQLADADGLLHQAEEGELAALQQARELKEKVQQAEDRHALNAAKLLAGRGNIALTQLQYADAAERFKQAGTLVPPGHPADTVDYLHRQADALYREGDERGDNTALERSVETWRVVLHYRTRVRVPLDWAMTQHNLGAALERLGERESGTARLEEAVAAYRAALEVVAAYYAALEEDVRYRVPWISWAMTQMNLGAALQTLGAREGGTARLEEALAAYSAALQEYTRDRAPLQWAMTQMNLGNVLQTLGEREGRTARLEEAVAAYRAALEECMRDRVPLLWAQLQMNLGNVLRILGVQESGTARLEEAVAAYRTALEECTRDRAPLQWAMTQNNLGIVLKTLGERESGTVRLEEAVKAYHAALEEYAPDRVPLPWAITQMNLGNVLATLGAREKGAARLEEALVAYRAALERDPLPIDTANTQFNMGLALVSLGRRKEALTCFQQAGPIFKGAGMLQSAEASDRLIARLQDEIRTGSPSAAPPKPDPN